VEIARWCMLHVVFGPAMLCTNTMSKEHSLYYCYVTVYVYVSTNCNANVQLQSLLYPPLSSPTINGSLPVHVPARQPYIGPHDMPSACSGSQLPSIYCHDTRLCQCCSHHDIVPPQLRGWAASDRAPAYLPATPKSRCLSPDQ
jgi:hypothetical protein